jgi:hypothetical protein
MSAFQWLKTLNLWLEIINHHKQKNHQRAHLVHTLRSRKEVGANTLNILDAAKSGRRIRRKSWEDKSAFLDSRSCKDVLSDDWEVEPPTVTFNREQFDEAWRKAIEKNNGYFGLHAEIVKELGL